MRFHPAAFFCLVSIGLLPTLSAFAQGPRIVAPASVTLPLKRNNNHLIVSVLVNGKPARLVIDTGAAVNVLTPEAASRLGVENGSSVTAKGARDTAATLSQIAMIELGDARLRQTPVLVVNLPPELEADGVLGVPLFTAFTVTLDYRNERLVLTPREREIVPPGAIVISLRQEKSNLFSTSASLFGIGGHYEVDTGNTGSLILFAPFVKKNQLETRFPKRLKTITGIGVGGFIYGQSARLPLLMLGEKSSVIGIIGSTIDIHNGEEGGFTSETLAGNIGAEIWSRFTVTFDVKRKKLYLQQNADFAKPFASNTTGLVARFVNGAMEVLDVLPDSPAKDAGFVTGDRIVSVNDLAIEPRIETPARISLRRAPVGVSLKIVYRRKGETADRVATIITRDLL